MHSVVGQLLVLNECTCPGQELRLECTVTAVSGNGGATVWIGSAFDCTHTNNEIVLFHYLFEDGRAVGECNDGAIVGRNIKRLGLNFTSQLVVQLDINSMLEGRTVACVHDNGSHETVVDTYTIVYTRGNLKLNI